MNLPTAQSGIFSDSKAHGGNWLKLYQHTAKSISAVHRRCLGKQH